MSAPDSDKKKARPRRATFSHVVPTEPHGQPDERRTSVQVTSPESSRARGRSYYQISADNGFSGDDYGRARTGSVSSVETADLHDHRPNVTPNKRDSGSSKQGTPANQQHQAGTGHEFSARRLLRAQNTNGRQQQHANSVAAPQMNTGISEPQNLEQPRHFSYTAPNMVERWVRRRSSLSNAPLLSSRHQQGRGQTDYDAITDGLNGGDSFAITVDDPQTQTDGVQDEDGFRRFSDMQFTDEDEIPRSNPSSRRSSDASSLHDVCFPMESPREVDSYTGETKVWPDLNILMEFAEEEMKQSSEEAIEVNEEEYAYPAQPQAHVENETDLEGRLRPHRIIPWAQRAAKKDTQLPDISNVKSPTQLRFTYFREDMDNTIHSPNISGLLQSGETFADLFPPRVSPAVPASQRTSNHNTNNQQHGGGGNHQTTYSEDFSGFEMNAPPIRGGTPVTGLPAEEHDPLSRAQTPAGSRTGSPKYKKKTSKQKLQPSRTQSSTNLPGQGTGTPSTAVGEPAPFWLNVVNPTEEEMKVLSRTFGIHPLTTEDIFLGESREKVELFRNYYFVCFSSIDMNWEKEKVRTKERERAKNLHKASNSKLKTTSTGYSEIPQDDNNMGGIFRRRKNSSNSVTKSSSSVREKRRRHVKARSSELKPLNMYILVFHEGVITFHFAPTAHPINVRRRARLLRDYITVSSDWISYALIDDVTDGFAPMIDAIEDEVNDIEDAILRMHSGVDSSDDSDNDDDGSDATLNSSNSSNSSTSTTRAWKEKGDMLRRIGECRKRVMSLLRLLVSKADVIKGFSKRCNEQWEVAPRSEIGMYLGDIQDHVVTMVQSLNHYEKLLARSHSNYLAQINIDMTRVNNDMNDVLGRITVLGTIVLPMNIVTGLWGMNVLVPGQDIPNLYWFWGITFSLILFAVIFFIIAQRVYKLV
ncbi:hypothetical protein TRICI_004259 [Trichomonascus ciferrii]|uniref:Uncharacterized protein n=1 Tax=Trichomonascus ciferrii TaxID=44093 RepID=A0A642V7Q2_9ASCO|nr:hypothetical protein TRICI_004259 [Trichomonascus ciferrii]